MSENDSSSITFRSKNEITCPACGTKFFRENMKTGRGRINAGELSDELRRTYLPTQKYGEVNPLLYPVTVCPNCLFSVFEDDFTRTPEKIQSKILDYQSIRAKYLIKMFGRVPDFLEDRDVYAGTASYVLAISSYSLFEPKKFSPTIKKGLCTLRAAWLLADLRDKENEPRYGELSTLFYKQAALLYEDALNKQSNGKEPIDYCPWLGPDADVNFGYNGFLYVSAILKYKMAVFIEDPFKKVKVYEECKRILSKVFGSGRKAREIPQDLLNYAKDYYEKIGNEMKAISDSLGDPELEGEEEMDENADIGEE